MDNLFLSGLTTAGADAFQQDILLDLLQHTYIRIAIVNIQDETCTALYDATGLMQERITFLYAPKLQVFSY